MAIASLKVINCDLLKERNGKAHHTDEYDTVTSRLVVRRGQVFDLRLTLNRVTNFPIDELRFEFHLGDYPRIVHNSKILLKDVDPTDGHGAPVGVQYSRINTGNSIDLKVFSPSDMGIGRWRLVVYSRRGKSRRQTMSFVSGDIVMIYNPWNKVDDVYMENEAWRNEYIMNDTGKQYYGSARRFGAMDWYFGQFEQEVLNAALRLIDMGSLPYRDHSDPVAVARHLSALVNSNDEAGVIVGNWSGKFDDGTNPSDWIGSYAILRQYLQTGEPVRYGQCWVFAGVLCTVLRALGIPARCVTNFDSAHDTDANLTIDYHYDEKDRSLDNKDSVWNFHVWNDVWMARPDLPKGFGGWQALDATPQERSSGLMRCGPMSVDAIKQGLIFHSYDGLFIYAEVNGTKKHWKRVSQNPEKWEELLAETAAIGKNMSTKRVGSHHRENITSQYKYPEGSPEEILSFTTARKYARFTKVDKVDTPKLVTFEADVPDSVPIGNDIAVTFKLTNISKVEQEVYIGVVAKVMQYNGSVVAKLHEISTHFKLAPGASDTVKATLKSSMYLPKTRNNNNSIKFYALGGVKKPTGGVSQSFAFNDSVGIVKPQLDLSTVRVNGNDSVKLTLSFTNPFSHKLQGGRLRVEGSGVTGVLEMAVPSIAAKAKFSKVITVKLSRRLGDDRMIIAGYSSPGLSGVQGSIAINI